MNLYLIWQDVNNGYDTYDSAVVVAETEEEAQRTRPTDEKNLINIYNDDVEILKIGSIYYDSWCHTKDVKVKYLGKADIHLQKGCICASFNAG